MVGNIALGVLLVVVLALFAQGCSITRSTLKEFRKPVPVSPSDPRIKDANRPFMLQGIEGREYALSLPHDTISIVSDDGLRLEGYLFRTGNGGGRVVLAVPGYHSWPFFAAGRFLKMYADNGLDALIICQRAHGSSEGKWTTFGIRESSDCLLWCRKLVDIYGPGVRIILHGTSMGAATVDMMSSSPDLPPQVRGAVSDCAFDYLPDLAYVKMPTLRPFLRVALPYMRFWGRHLADIDLFAAAPRESVPSARIPIFFIHGESDGLVPPSMARHLSEICPTSAGLLMVPSAAHSSSFVTDPAAYAAAFRKLLDVSFGENH